MTTTDFAEETVSAVTNFASHAGRDREPIVGAGHGLAAERRLEPEPGVGELRAGVGDDPRLGRVEHLDVVDAAVERRRRVAHQLAEADAAHER
ncbi:MAG: hypothetical protein GXX90_02790, partial [Microbacteriaceae bacterium]|nr:hypothetical protein [Microbacteriaceae bacterium]